MTERALVNFSRALEWMVEPGARCQTAEDEKMNGSTRARNRSSQLSNQQVWSLRGEEREKY